MCTGSTRIFNKTPNKGESTMDKLAEKLIEALGYEAAMQFAETFAPANEGLQTAINTAWEKLPEKLLKNNLGTSDISDITCVLGTRVSVNVERAKYYSKDTPRFVITILGANKTKCVLHKNEVIRKMRMLDQAGVLLPDRRNVIADIIIVEV